MIEAKTGDTVKIHYIGKFENGEEFDSTYGGEPIDVQIGSEVIFPAVEQNLIGMKPGDKKTITLQPEQAFGRRLDALILEIDKSVLPLECPVKIGTRLKNKQPDGKLIDVTITRVDGDQITLDANHPLAGRVLILDIEMVELD